jgi:hypothetical protein
MIALAVRLLPMAVMAEGGGPTKAIPASRHSWANAAFSERNPYPGWIAVAPDRRATSMMSSWSR